jgi:transglutaminase-like putative cysteine protease
MTFQVVHTTRYQYSAPVSRCRNEAHLRPRETVRQRCLSNTVQVTPAPVSWTERIDFFGNPVAAFAVDGPFDELVITSTSEVAVEVREPLPPVGPSWERARDLLSTDLTPEVLDARQYCFDSPQVPPSSAVAAYAASSFENGQPLVDSVSELTARIFDDFAYDPGFTTITTPLEDVLLYRRGVCQDFAHLAIGCLRSVGLSARYVSGYLETAPPPGEDRLIGADASHAWASVFIPGWGWLDIDPTNDRVVGSSYVTIAWGRDYSDVSPLKGIVFGGGDSHTLDVSVDVTRLHPVAS